MSRAIDLTEDITEYLEQYYPDEQFSNLYEASKALLEISKESEEDGDEDDEEWEEEDDEFSDGSAHEEPAQPMTELDKVLQSEERYLQMERTIQIEKRNLQNWEEEDDEFSDGADHEKQVHAIAQEIERQIAEKTLQILEEKEIKACQLSC